MEEVHVLAGTGDIFQNFEKSLVLNSCYESLMALAAKASLIDKEDKEADNIVAERVHYNRLFVEAISIKGFVYVIGD